MEKIDEQLASLRLMLDFCQSRTDKKELQRQIDELENKTGQNSSVPAGSDNEVLLSDDENAGFEKTATESTDFEPSDSEVEMLLSDTETDNRDIPSKLIPKLKIKIPTNSKNTTLSPHPEKIPNQNIIVFDSESDSSESDDLHGTDFNDPDFTLSSEFIQSRDTTSAIEQEFERKIEKANFASFTSAKTRVLKLKAEVKRLKQQLKQMSADDPLAESTKSSSSKLVLGSKRARSMMQKKLDEARKALEDAKFVADMREESVDENSKLNDFNKQMDVERMKGKEMKRLNRKRKKEMQVDDIVSQKEFFSDNHPRDYESRVGHLLHRPLSVFSTKNVQINDEYTVKMPTSKNSQNTRGWSDLYPYQQDGIKWLWKLHRKQVGGIVGDEMGLGKTVQICTFFNSLYFTQNRLSKARYRGLGPSLIICPATLVYQWVQELHKWAPFFKVLVLHNSSGNTEAEIHRQLKQSFRTCLKQTEKHDKSEDSTNLTPPVIIIATYGKLRHAEGFIDYQWHYAILDEGHQIRNPEAKLTIAAKKLRTCHRLILSGTPIQNNLKELWCLYDFCYPSLLGTLPVFMEEIATPIQQGGYANANDGQVRLAYKCACTLKETITPYLLRRTKKGVNHMLSLPDKKDQILFCKLTKAQIEAYKMYQSSEDCNKIMRGDMQSFAGLITLRKICNHADLYTQKHCVNGSFGDTSRSGKLIVLKSLLKMWHDCGTDKFRVLVFTQSRDLKRIIVNRLLKDDFPNADFIEMDGTTSIGQRQKLVKRFNEDKGVFCMVLTTKVGGLGLNLIGANRVVIFDPDWNPSTDLQAQERSWRIGQEKSVVVYRLLTAGAIEEKIYHRQIQKQFLSTKILSDPKQKRLFTATSLKSLFELGKMYDSKEEKLETSKVLETTKSEFKKPTNLAVSIAKARMKFNNRKVDGIQISDFIEKKRKYKDPFEDKDKSKSGIDENKATESDILTTILENSNVKSAFDHEKVLKNSREDDYVLIEHEAEQKAKQAFKKLKTSQETQCVPGIPTFTGNGDHAAAALLRAIKARNLIEAPSSSEERFMKKFKEFIESWAGNKEGENGREGLSSDKIAEEIDSWNEFGLDPPFVKACLNLLCKQSKKTGWWKLKDVY
jgi:SNF2 family DNA or RNA helicase